MRTRWSEYLVTAARRMALLASICSHCLVMLLICCAAHIRCSTPTKLTSLYILHFFTPTPTPTVKYSSFVHLLYDDPRSSRRDGARAMRADGAESPLRTWLRVQLPSTRRWEALHRVCARPICRTHPWLLQLMLWLEQPGRRPTRASFPAQPLTGRERRAAAVGLLQICRHNPTLREGPRVQSAIARAIALALPKRLSTPRLLRGLLSVDECSSLLAAAQQHGQEHGWGSLHRQYPTVDIPVASLRGGAEVTACVRARAFPAFERFFGAPYGPPESLTLRDCFVAKYEAAGQTGLAGHVDASFLSLVMTLNHPSSFDHGGTYFEHIGETFNPDQGDAICFLGKVYHEALPITRGVRFVLVALIDRRANVQEGQPTR